MTTPSVPIPVPFGPPAPPVAVATPAPAAPARPTPADDPAVPAPAGAAPPQRADQPPVAAAERSAAEADAAAARFRTALRTGPADEAITSAAQVGPDQADTVLADDTARADAVSLFDDEEMLRAMRALNGDLLNSLLWLFAEGNDFSDHRTLLGERSTGFERARASTNLREQYVDLVDNSGMADAVELFRGDLVWKLRWMAAEGSSWSLVQAKLVAAPTDQRLAVYAATDLIPLFVDVCNNREMAAAADLLGGTVVQKFAFVREEGSDADILQRWAAAAPLAERIGLYGSGAALSTAVDTCDNDEMKVLVNTIGGTVPQKVYWLRAEGVFDYTPAAGPTPDAPPAAPFTRPVIFGIEGLDVRRGGRVYASVAAPGHTAAEVAMYLYGVPDGTLLPGAAENLAAGQKVELPAGRALAPAAQADLTQAQENGTVLRGAEEASPAETFAADGQPLVYDFSAGGTAYRLTAVQMRGMLRGVAAVLRRRAWSLRSSAESLREGREWHYSGTNRFIRWSADLVGGVDLPDATFADSAINAGQEAENGFNAVLAADSIDAGQQAMRTALQRYEDAARDEAVASITWHAYINGTTEGAGSIVSALEIVRDASFAIAAGIAGAIAAPLVFGAAATALAGTAVAGTLGATGTTILAGGLAIGGGALAGGVTRGGLELIGGTGGQLVNMAITPGSQRFDFGEVGSRTGRGFVSGLGDGALGAASYFQGAYLASRFGTAFAATNRGRMILGAIGGGSSELLLSTGHELLAPGPGGPSLTRIVVRTAVGTALGAGMARLPIDGLYRTRAGGGVSFVPFRGSPVTPEWMLASPWHYVQPAVRTPGVVPAGAGPTSVTATGSAAFTPRGMPNYRAINDLPAAQLPILPENYSWARVNGTEWAIVRPPNSPPIEVYVWDNPSVPGGFQYTVRQAEAGAGMPSRMLQSQATAGTTTRPQTQRSEPFDTADYTDPATGTVYRRGHGIDHGDTRATMTPSDATGDPANFSPQTIPWNDKLRNQIVQSIRRGASPVPGGTGVGPNPIYREVTYYTNTPGRTVNPGASPGPASQTAIPEGVYFIVADAAGTPRFAWRVRTADAPTFAVGTGGYPVNSARFAIPLNQVPAPVLEAAGLRGIGGTVAGAVDETGRQSSSTR